MVKDIKAKENEIRAEFAVPKKLEQGILNLIKGWKEDFYSDSAYFQKLVGIEEAYSAQTEQTEEAKKAAASGQRKRLKDVNTPTVLEQVESGVAHQESVFLQGMPMFPVVADRAHIDAATQVEAVIWEEEQKGGWRKKLIQTFRDAYKHNLFAVELDWKKIPAYGVETDLAVSLTEGVAKENLWEGNCLTRLSLFRTFFDRACAPAEVTEFGDYIGYDTPMTRQRLKRFLVSLDGGMTENYGAAYRSTPSYSRIMTPQLDTGRTKETWADWYGYDEGIDKKYKEYKNDFIVTTVYARLSPDEFGLRGGTAIRIVKFVVVNDSVLVCAEALSNAHEFFPIILGQLLEDDYEMQTKSLAEYVKPFQELENALWTSVIETRRRAVIDRTVYDPSRISPKDINAENPSAQIPLLPAAYGTQPSAAIQPLPFRDDNSAIIMQEIAALDNYTNRIMGSNPMRQGQFVKGNKTRFEVQQTMGGAYARDILLSVQFESALFTPLKRMLLLNILQYQQSDTAYSAAKKELVQIDPATLRQATLYFKVADGLTPSQNLTDQDMLQVAMQTMLSVPQIGQSYDVGDLFGYIMKLGGAHIQDFKLSPEILAYNQQVEQWKQLVLQMVKENPEITPDKYPPQPVPPSQNQQQTQQGAQ